MPDMQPEAPVAAPGDHRVEHPGDHRVEHLVLPMPPAGMQPTPMPPTTAATVMTPTQITPATPQLTLPPGVSPMLAGPPPLPSPTAGAPGMVPVPSFPHPGGAVHPYGPAMPSPPSGDGLILHRGREKIPWPKEIWDHLDMAVHEECSRTRVAAKFLPIHKVPAPTTTLPSDFVLTPDAGPQADTFTVDEGAVVRVIELAIEIALTPQQLEQEMQIEHAHRGHSTAVTLATRAANLLTRAEDMLVFQGLAAFDSAFFTSNVKSRGKPLDYGLLDMAPAGDPLELPADQIISVPEKGSAGVYGENTFRAVAQGYAVLQGKGHYGPFALTLHTVPYADTHAPLVDTLIMPADRIKPLMTAGFFGSGTLFAGSSEGEPSFTGSLVSVGGNTMDLVVGWDATTTFMQQDSEGYYRLRVVERVALRLKDLSALILLEFQ